MSRARSILILDAAPFHDAALVLGPLATRRVIFPGERVTLAAPAGVGEIAGALGIVDEVWETPEVSQPARGAHAAVAVVSLLVKAQRGRFDAVFDLFPRATSMAAALLATGGRAIHASPGYSDAVFGARRAGPALDDPVERIAGILGVAALAASAEVAPSPDADAWIERALAATGYAGGPIALVHTRGLWPRECFVGVAERLRSSNTAWIVTLDVPRGERRAPQLAEALGGRVLGVAAPTGPRFIAALTRSSVVLTDDAGVAAIAGWCGVPAVFVTEAGATGLPTHHDRIVLVGQDASRISPDAVYDAVSTFIGKSRTSSLFSR